jgi:HSP20 family protein
LADIPGVVPEDLNIDLRINTLTISGEVVQAECEDEKEVMLEHETGNFLGRFHFLK